MREITLEELLEAGCHFGHQVTRANPKAREFVFEARDGIHIIDLVKTKEGLEEAGNFILDAAISGGKLLVVGTKRQARPLVEEALRQAQGQGATDGLFWVTNRWVGGTLTNLSEVAKNCKKLKDFRVKLADDEEKAKYTKREVGLWEKERLKLESLYGGVEDMQEVPTSLFVIDTHLEDLAVKEAIKMGVTTVGIVDTNADPRIIDHPIPANDDAVGSIKLIVNYIIDAWIEGKKQLSKDSKKTEGAKKHATTEDTEEAAESTGKKQRKTTVARKAKKSKNDKIK